MSRLGMNVLSRRRIERVIAKHVQAIYAGVGFFRQINFNLRFGPHRHGEVVKDVAVGFAGGRYGRLKIRVQQRGAVAREGNYPFWLGLLSSAKDDKNRTEGIEPDWQAYCGVGLLIYCRPLDVARVRPPEFRMLVLDPKCAHRLLRLRKL